MRSLRRCPPWRRIPLERRKRRNLTNQLVNTIRRCCCVLVLSLVGGFSFGLQATTVSTAYGTSYQVNVNAAGQNIPGDAANEPSFCIDPTNPNRMAVGWRQFDTTNSNFRQSGVAYSTNGGLNWTFPGNLEPGTFRSDPVLAADANGIFYYLGISNANTFACLTSTKKTA